MEAHAPIRVARRHRMPIRKLAPTIELNITMNFTRPKSVSNAVATSMLPIRKTALKVRPTQM